FLRTKKVGSPCESFSVVSGRARHMRRTRLICLSFIRREYARLLLYATPLPVAPFDPVLLNTTRSDKRKFASEQIAIVNRFDLAAPMRVGPTRSRMNRSFPAIDTAPVVRLNRISIRKVPAPDPIGDPHIRSDQVQRRCQMKLWMTAASTANAVAAR